MEALDYIIFGAMALAVLFLVFGWWLSDIFGEEDPYYPYHNDDYKPQTKPSADSCAHEAQHIKIIGITFLCETTVTACSDCGKHLDKPITHC